ncbi:MAG: PleD family two-component system response regulator [Rhodospirillales bacterium]|nr:PleD family two-component system response regulator [Rhodospirillales bacterium]MCB9965978.1 PleD family two-component system response regulator [Rhodospirillales bacterium]MCB9973348.1 PleD family two-component system response regulator [Rhodospirillales bacterium]MCB9980550.1 PleD family two-component system response regulator [Rhodospirillales bacterium]
MSARILVVDDILPNIKLLEARLNSEYYDVLTATSGAEALEKVASDSPDMVLLDIMMPGMDGFEVCRKIKENPRTAHIPVVMVTALTEAEDRVRGLEAGADDFLSKPINDTALMARVRSLIRLKITVDEWRVRENTANQLGVANDQVTAMKEPVEHARVLIIEDQDFEVEKLSGVLQRDRDDCIAAAGGAEAMRHIQAEPFDLVIVSLNLEEEDGLRLCSHLRSNEKTRATPIIMIGLEDGMDKIARGLEMGVHDYILRPVDRNEFLARARTQIRRKRFQDRLRSNYENNLSMAVTDPLTGLYNRRYMETHLSQLLSRQEAHKKPLGILLLDIDHFKKVNDTYGHHVGDEVLKEFSRRVSDSLRSFDLVARLGGEEFVVILPDVTEEKAHFIAERLRASIAEEPISCGTDTGYLSITTSVGGMIVHNGGHSVESVLERADKCLYEAKENGRNRTFFEKAGFIHPEKYREAPREMIE